MPSPLPRLIVIALSMLATAGAAGAEADPERHRWDSRLLLAFAPSAEASGWAELQARLERRGPALDDRDLLVYRIPGNESSLNGEPLSPGQAEDLRRRFGVAEDESVLILVGKDGGVKRRAPLGTELSVLFRQIDAMPMRRREVEEKRRSGEPVTPP